MSSGPQWWAVLQDWKGSGWGEQLPEAPHLISLGVRLLPGTRQDVCAPFTQCLIHRHRGQNTHTHTDTNTHEHTLAREHTHEHTSAHTHEHMNTHDTHDTHTRAHTHTWTQMSALFCPPPWRIIEALLYAFSFLSVWVYSSLIPVLLLYFLVAPEDNEKSAELGPLALFTCQLIYSAKCFSFLNLLRVLFQKFTVNIDLYWTSHCIGEMSNTNFSLMMF